MEVILAGVFIIWTFPIIFCLYEHFKRKKERKINPLLNIA